MDWMIPLLENSQDEGWSLYSKVASGLDKGVLDDAFIRWQETLKDEATRTSETDILADSIRSALILALLWVPNKMIPMDARHTANEVSSLGA
ncbi:hypothetical protein BC832DRAFT_68600 [Gaertneriomyces semiglobifer]|nr:hypothetical protein BC832DRAFT_68600 [Gaertneriomyces semiglobifer]